jgi:hypothetical protein
MAIRALQLPGLGEISETGAARCAGLPIGHGRRPSAERESVGRTGRAFTVRHDQSVTAVRTPPALLGFGGELGILHVIRIKQVNLNGTDTTNMPSFGPPAPEH